jgi:hypothetical protein
MSYAQLQGARAIVAEASLYWNEFVFDTSAGDDLVQVGLDSLLLYETNAGEHVLMPALDLFI